MRDRRARPRRSPRRSDGGGAEAWCLARPGEVYLVYLVYLSAGGEAQLDLGGAAGPFAVQWFDPRRGGALQAGVVTGVKGPGKVALGPPPREPDQDWAVLVRRRP